MQVTSVCAAAALEYLVATNRAAQLIALSEVFTCRPVCKQRASGLRAAVSRVLIMSGVTGVGGRKV